MNTLDVKQIRTKLRLSQEKLGEKLGVSKRTIINYEKEGASVPDSIQKLLQHLINEGETNSPDGENEVKVKEAYELAFMDNKNGNGFMTLPNSQLLMTMPLVEYKAQAGFLDHYQDIEHLEEMEQHSIVVDRFVKGRYVAFRVNGHSMDNGTSEAILHNSIVSTRELQQHHWKDKLRINDFQYWIIYTTKTSYPMLKQITEHDTERGIIKCHSLNDGPEYQDFEISLNDVKALFYVVDVSRQVSRKMNY